MIIPHFNNIFLCEKCATIDTCKTKTRKILEEKETVIVILYFLRDN